MRVFACVFACVCACLRVCLRVHLHMLCASLWLIPFETLRERWRPSGQKLSHILLITSRQQARGGAVTGLDQGKISRAQAMPVVLGPLIRLY